jgi:capsular exopolysaccharide synthesis family protein
LSSHLAASIARAGRRTVIVDCDLRRPSVHLLFDMPSEPGMCDLLRGEAEVADLVQTTPLPGLSLLAAGRCDTRALQGLAQGGLRQIFDQLKEQFDFIVIDSAPVLPVADSLQVGQHVDAVVFSVLREVSRTPAVYAAYHRMASLGIRMLGAIVNGAKTDSYGYAYYSYGYGYGYGYGRTPENVTATSTATVDEGEPPAASDNPDESANPDQPANEGASEE